MTFHKDYYGSLGVLFPVSLDDPGLADPSLGDCGGLVWVAAALVCSVRLTPSAVCCGSVERRQRRRSEGRTRPIRNRLPSPSLLTFVLHLASWFLPLIPHPLHHSCAECWPPGLHFH